MGPNAYDLVEPGDTITGGLQSGVMGMAAGMVPQIQKMLPKLDSILANVNMLLSDPALKNSLHNIDDITANLKKTSNELNTMTASLNNQMHQTLQNVEEMTAKLNSNEGTLGLLMRDPQLYNNLNSTMMHADSLVIDLKQHPKRYVHFSVFGKKDK